MQPAEQQRGANRVKCMKTTFCASWTHSCLKYLKNAVIIWCQHSARKAAQPFQACLYELHQVCRDYLCSFRGCLLHVVCRLWSCCPRNRSAWGTAGAPCGHSVQSSPRLILSTRWQASSPLQAQTLTSAAQCLPAGAERFLAWYHKGPMCLCLHKIATCTGALHESTQF